MASIFDGHQLLLAVKQSPWLAAAAMLTIVGGIYIKRFMTYERKETDDVATVGNPDEMLHVYVPSRLAPAAGTASPFGTKLLTYLRFLNKSGRNINYVVKKADFRKAPKGKMPYVKLGDVVLGDTELIFRFMSNTYKLSKTSSPADASPQFVPFDSLTTEQQAVSTLVTRTADEHLYWGIVYYSWVKDKANEKNWEITATRVLKDMPKFIVAIMGASIRKMVSSNLSAHGIGRHSEKDMLFLFERDLIALSRILGNKKYINGDSACDGDCSLFAMLDAILFQPRESPLKDIAARYPNLTAYTKRIRTELYSDLEGNDNDVFSPRK